MNNNSGYLTEIKKVWDLKETVYEETKNKSFKEYTDLMNKEISEIQKKFENKYVSRKMSLR